MADGVDPDRAVAVEHLTKRYGSEVAVDDLTFSIPTGTIAGFLGPNGAGKTTTFRMLVGWPPPPAVPPPSSVGLMERFGNQQTASYMSRRHRSLGKSNHKAMDKRRSRG